MFSLTLFDGGYTVWNTAHAIRLLKGPPDDDGELDRDIIKSVC